MFLEAWKNQDFRHCTFQYGHFVVAKLGMSPVSKPTPLGQAHSLAH